MIGEYTIGGEHLFTPNAREPIIIRGYSAACNLS